MRKKFVPLILALVVSLAGCAQTPVQTVAVSQSAWNLPADRKSRTEVNLTKGFTRDHVIGAMGEPKRTRSPKNEPRVEVLIYDRVVLGPTAARTVNTMSGPVTVTKPILYNYHVEVILTDGAVSNVIIDRTISGENERPFAEL